MILRSRDHDIDQLQIALRKERAENERLRSALEPFGYPDNCHVGFDPAMQAARLTVADLRAALHTYEQKVDGK